MTLARLALAPLTPLYGGVMRLRNFAFDRGLRRVYRLPVPVWSVGNLTVGGTGKTPLVAWLVEQLRAAGRRPGVLARGYRRPPGALLNDEGRMLAARFPDLPQEQDPDRVRGGERLVARGVDIVVLDDGFQHRRLHRDRDIVCVDAARPFANGWLLPAGDLREPPSGLRRAQIVVLTRAGALTPDELARSVARVRDVAGPGAAVHAADHAPVALLSRPDDHELPLAMLRGLRVVLLSAIGQPRAFEATVGALGAIVVRHVVRRDHHAHTEAELASIAVDLVDRDLVLVTTEKDDAKLAGSQVPRLVLRIAMRFVGAAPEVARWLR